MPTSAKKAVAKKSAVVKTAAKSVPAKKLAASVAATEGVTPPTAGLPAAAVKTIMRFHLRNLNTSGQPTNDETVLGSALSDLAVAGMSARSLFKALTRRDIVRNGGNDKAWPAKWPEETINSLAPKLAG